MALSVPTNYEDPQDLINSIDDNTSLADMTKIQLAIGLLMAKITAVSAIIKSTTDTEKDIAGRM